MTDRIQIVYIRTQPVVEQIQLVYDRIQLVYVRNQPRPDRKQIVYNRIQFVTEQRQINNERMLFHLPLRGSLYPFERSQDPRRGFLNIVPPFEGLRPLEGWGVLLYSSAV